MGEQKFYKVLTRDGEVKEVSAFIYNTPRLMARQGYTPLAKPEKPKANAKKETIQKEDKEVKETMSEEEARSDLSDAKLEGVSVFDIEKVKVNRWAKPLIKEHNIDISGIKGSGKDGMIMRKDIEHLIKEK